MPIIQCEMHESRDFDLTNRSVGLTRHWFVGGTMDETEAYLTALTSTPEFYDNLVREGISAKPMGGGNWYAQIKYKNIDPQHVLPTDGGPGGGGSTPSAGGPATDTTELPSSYAWSTTGGTDIRKVSFATVEKKSASGFTANDYTRSQAVTAGFMLDNQRAINSTAEGVAGVSVFVPKFEWSREVVKNTIDQAYTRSIRNMTGRVNNAMFYRWAEGDVLYMGADARQENGRWKITHRFAVNETRLSVEVGNGIVLEKVKGWEYVSVEYMPKPVNGRILNVPKTAHVEQPYETGNFEILEIGA